VIRATGAAAARAVARIIDGKNSVDHRGQILVLRAKLADANETIRNLQEQLAERDKFPKMLGGWF
jgi:hypothetical protein